MTTTPAARPVQDDVEVVEVYGSKFLLEWLDLEFLASAAAQPAAAESPVEQAA